MDEKRIKALREWVQQWEKTGPELDRIRKLEAGNFGWWDGLTDRRLSLRAKRSNLLAQIALPRSARNR